MGRNGKAAPRGSPRCLRQDRRSCAPARHDAPRPPRRARGITRSEGRAVVLMRPPSAAPKHPASLPARHSRNAPKPAPTRAANQWLSPRNAAARQAAAEPAPTCRAILQAAQVRGLAMPAAARAADARRAARVKSNHDSAPVAAMRGRARRAKPNRWQRQP